MVRSIGRAATPRDPLLATEPILPFFLWSSQKDTILTFAIGPPPVSTETSQKQTRVPRNFTAFSLHPPPSPTPLYLSLHPTYAIILRPISVDCESTGRALWIPGCRYIYMNCKCCSVLQCVTVCVAVCVSGGRAMRILGCSFMHEL